MSKKFGFDEVAVMGLIGFKKENAGTIGLMLDSMAAGLLKMYIWRPGNDNYGQPKQCEISCFNNDSEKVCCEFACAEEGVSCVLELIRSQCGYTGKLRASGKGHVIVRLIWEGTKQENSFPFVPGFMYGYNEGGKNPLAMYPQLLSAKPFDRTKPWISNEWLMRADRSSHCLTSVIGDKYTYAFSGRDVCFHTDGTIAEKNGLGISSEPQQVSFFLGFRNFPFTYSALPERNYFSRPEGFINLDKGEVISEFSLFLFETKSRYQAASKLLRESYACFDDNVDCDPDIDGAIAAIAGALSQYGYNEDARNFNVAIQANQDKSNAQNGFSNGWAGGIQAAFPLLQAGHKLNESQWIDHARSVISNLARNAVSVQSGMFYENYDLSKNIWNIRGWWCGSMDTIGHSGYVNGQMCYYMLKAYHLEQENGKNQQLWYDSAKKVLDHVAAVQGSKGQFGYIYSEADGTILDDDGFCGCWFVPAFATLYQISGEKQYLEYADRAMRFYRRFVESFEVYGCPHDAYKSPDEEGIIAWVNAARILHAITHDEIYLKDLLIGLDYEFSWKFAYNVQNEVEPLKSLKWCSRGGSITSVNNSHVHPMGSAIAECILYAAEHTGDEYYWSRLADTVCWTLNAYLHYDGEYGWGKKGLINERFCYSDSLLTERFADGSPAATWFCGHSWASGSVLEGLTGKIYEFFKNDNAKLLRIDANFTSLRNEEQTNA